MVTIESSLAQPAFARLHRIVQASNENGTCGGSDSDSVASHKILPSIQLIGGQSIS